MRRCTEVGLTHGPVGHVVELLADVVGRPVALCCPLQVALAPQRDASHVEDQAFTCTSRVLVYDFFFLSQILFDLYKAKDVANCTKLKYTISRTVVSHLRRKKCKKKEKQ
jgi:hypothetical protein